MEIIDKDYQEFLKAAQEHAERRGVKTIAADYPCSTNHLYQILNEDKKAGNKAQLKFALACKFKSVSDFVQSVSKTKRQEDRVIRIDTQEDWEHFKVTRKFKNKDLAIQANEALVELEKIDSLQFAKAVIDIMERLKCARKGKQDERREPGRKAAGGE